MTRIAVILLAAALAAGCNTTPVRHSEAKPVAPDRLLAFQQKTPDATAVIVATRDAGFVASGCFMGFWIDGKLSARFDPGETARFYVPAGERLLRYEIDPLGKGLCGADPFDTKLTVQRETIVRAGETKYFRLMILPEGNALDIQRSSE